MSAQHSNHQEEEDDDLQLRDEDIVEVHEDEGEGGEPMSDDEDDVQGGFVPDDGEGPYDGEIVIGGPGPGEDDEYMEMDGEGEGEGEEARPDNSWGASGEYSDRLHGSDVLIDSTARRSAIGVHHFITSRFFQRSTSHLGRRGRCRVHFLSSTC
jgi:hypothetical protein